MVEKIFGLFMFLTFLSACSYIGKSTTPSPYDNPAPTSAVPGDQGKGGADAPVPAEPELPDISNGRIPSFKEVELSILAPACYRCHSSATVTRGDVNLDNLPSIRQNTNDILDDVSADLMPRKRPPLNAQEKAVLFAWLNAGAPEFEIPAKAP